MPAWGRALRRYWWVVAAVVAIVLVYRYFNPSQPTMTHKSGVECADRYAIALVDPAPVDGAWNCTAVDVKAVWGDIGFAQDKGIADWAKERFPASSIRFVGHSHHIAAGDPSQYQVDPTDLSADEYYRLYGLWYVFEAQQDQVFCISFNGGCQPARALVFIQMDKADQTVNQWDIGYCESGLVGSIDCPATLSKVTAT